MALDQSLQRALAVYRSATADQVQHAHRRVARLKAQAIKTMEGTT